MNDKEFNLEERLEEIKALGYVPKQRDLIRFKDESAVIGQWIVLHKEELMKLAETNEIAKNICEEKDWLLKNNPVIKTKNKKYLEKQILGELKRTLEKNNINNDKELTEDDLKTIREDINNAITK